MTKVKIYQNENKVRFNYYVEKIDVETNSEEKIEEVEEDFETGLVDATASSKEEISEIETESEESVVDDAASSEEEISEIETESEESVVDVATYSEEEISEAETESEENLVDVDLNFETMVAFSEYIIGRSDFKDLTVDSIEIEIDSPKLNHYKHTFMNLIKELLNDEELLEILKEGKSIEKQETIENTDDTVDSVPEDTN